MDIHKTYNEITIVSIDKMNQSDKKKIIFSFLKKLLHGNEIGN